MSESKEKDWSEEGEQRGILNELTGWATIWVKVKDKGGCWCRGQGSQSNKKKKTKWKCTCGKRRGRGGCGLVCRGLAAFDEEETIFLAVASFTSLTLWWLSTAGGGESLCRPVTDGYFMRDDPNEFVFNKHGSTLMEWCEGGIQMRLFIISIQSKGETLHKYR